MSSEVNVKSFFQEWYEIYSRIQIAQRVLLLCDYDGTLTPIVSRPQLAILSTDMKNLLVELNNQTNVIVGVISGRNLDEIKQMISIPNLIYAGNHGMEISGPHINYTVPISRETWQILEEIKKTLTERLGNLDGILIEDKGLTLSIHYRLVAEDCYPIIKNAVENITGQYEILGKIKLTSGKKVFEIRPGINWHKGRAVNLLIDLLAREKGVKDCTTIYLGDDCTDEDGFQAVNQTDNGVSILVTKVPAESAATYFLESTEDVMRFLARLLAIMSAKSEK